MNRSPLNRPSDAAAPRGILTAATAAVFLGAIDLSVIATVLPDIIADLAINTADIDRFIWVVTGYLIAYVAAIPFAGMLADSIGYRSALVIAVLVFSVGSVVCATADSLQHLVLGRAIQGAGGGGLLPVAITVAGAIADDLVRTRTIGRIAAIDMVGWLVGPTYGAMVVLLPAAIDEPWRWIFWLNLPLVAGLLYPILQSSPSTVHMRRHRRADWLGATLLAFAIVAMSLGITSSGEVGTTTTGLRAFGGTPNPMADHLPLLLTTGTVAAVLFVLRQRLSTAPMIPRTVVRRPGGLAALAANVAVGTAMMVTVVNVPVVVALTEPAGCVSIVSAILLAAFTGAIVVTAFIGDRLLESWPVARRLTLGIVCTAVGMSMSYPLLDALDPLRMMPALFVAGLGIGLLLSPMTNAGLVGIERRVAGTSVSLVLLARLLGMTIGVSALTAIGIRRLQSLTGRLDPMVQESGESTASWLARQQTFVTEHAIPLAVQVVQETFLIGAVIALLALVPLLRMPRSGSLERGDRLGD